MAFIFELYLPVSTLGRANPEPPPIQIPTYAHAQCFNACAQITFHIFADTSEKSEEYSEVSIFFHNIIMIKNTTYQDQSNSAAGDASMEGLIKTGTLALQLLPRNALKGGA